MGQVKEQNGKKYFSKWINFLKSKLLLLHVLKEAQLCLSFQSGSWYVIKVLWWLWLTIPKERPHLLFVKTKKERLENPIKNIK